MVTIEQITIQDVLKEMNSNAVIVDARSEHEFNHACIPNAVNIPLLNDEQRAIVGTIYKTEGKNAAIRKGFELCGKDFHQKIKALDDIEDNSKKIIVYCWRGGLRSYIMSWLFTVSGFKVYQLENGYKNFRNQLLKTFEKTYQFIVLGGYTGSKKTFFLEKLKQASIPTIDLEKLANHRGSAFGALGLGLQPSQEHFENLLAIELLKKKDQLIFVENESRMIGKKFIPGNIYKNFENSIYILLESPIEKRIENIKYEYLKYDINELKECTLKLNKKLGGYNCILAINFLEAEKYDEWIEILLKYYDKNYNASFLSKDYKKVLKINTYNKSDDAIIKELTDIYHFETKILN